MTGVGLRKVGGVGGKIYGLGGFGKKSELGAGVPEEQNKEKKRGGGREDKIGRE